MMDLPDKETRVALGNHALFKSNIYKSVDSLLFIESSNYQAQDIAAHSRKPVFCTETWQMISADRFAQYRNQGEYVSDFRKGPLTPLIKLGKLSITTLRTLIWKTLARLKKQFSKRAAGN